MLGMLAYSREALVRLVSPSILLGWLVPRAGVVPLCGSPEDSTLRVAPSPVTAFLSSNRGSRPSRATKHPFRMVGAPGRTRTGTALRPGDFKSPVSTIPPPGQSGRDVHQARGARQ
jgi:hypothetical protein